MFTRCPECATVFRLGAEELRRAAGQVRCGDCGALFQALEHLQDHPDASPFDAGDFRVSSDPVLSPTRTDRSPPIGDLFDPPREDEDAPSPESDGDLPVGGADDELETPLGPLAEGSADEAADEAADETAAGSREEGAGGADIGHAGAEDPDADEPAAAAKVEDDGAAASPGLDAGEHPPRTAPAWSGFDAPPEPGGLVWPWAVGLVLALLTGTALAVHQFRQELVLVEPLAPWLERIYGVVEEPVAPPAVPSLIRVSRAEMVSHPSLPGALVLTATLTNEAEYPQPLPVIRLTMEDRWGEVLAGRDFGPADWLRTDRRLDRPLEPGERTAIRIEVADPSPEAVGFQITVCLENPDGLLCADDGV